MLATTLNTPERLRLSTPGSARARPIDPDGLARDEIPGVDAAQQPVADPSAADHSITPAAHSSWTESGG
jgi:hypothetical protein